MVLVWFSVLIRFDSFDLWSIYSCGFYVLAWCHDSSDLTFAFILSTTLRNLQAESSGDDLHQPLLSKKLSLWSSVMKHNYVECSIFGCCFSLMKLNLFSYFLFACKVFDEKSIVTLMEVSSIWKREREKERDWFIFLSLAHSPNATTARALPDQNQELGTTS